MYSIRRFTIVGILSAISFIVCGQKNIEKIFIDMPDIYIPQLQDAWRKDLVDLYKSGEEAKLKNLRDGYSVLKEMTEDYLLLQTTERTVIEMKLLPIEKGTNIICMITTFSAPVSDSKIDFFTFNRKLSNICA